MFYRGVLAREAALDSVNPILVISFSNSSAFAHRLRCRPRAFAAATTSAGKVVAATAICCVAILLSRLPAVGSSALSLCSLLQAALSLRLSTIVSLALLYPV